MDIAEHFKEILKIAREEHKLFVEDTDQTVAGVLSLTLAEVSVRHVLPEDKRFLQDLQSLFYRISVSIRP